MAIFLHFHMYAIIWWIEFGIRVTYLQFLYSCGRIVIFLSWLIYVVFLGFYFLFKFVFSMMRGAVRCIMRILSVYHLSLWICPCDDHCLRDSNRCRHRQQWPLYRDRLHRKPMRRAKNRDQLCEQNANSISIHFDPNQTFHSCSWTLEICSAHRQNENNMNIFLKLLQWWIDNCEIIACNL